MDLLSLISSIVYVQTGQVHKVKLTLGSGCNTASESTPRNREVIGLNHAECQAFFLIYSLSRASLIQAPQGGATLLIFLQKYA